MASPIRLGKRLIVSCDGTWRSADTGVGKDPTNAIDFCRALSQNAQGDRKEQIVFYHAGVASGPDLPIQKAIAGGMGLGLEENAEDAYSFIAHNYVDGDEIFILGFSRGAYTARFVASLLGMIGILSRSGMLHFKPIIEIYKAAQSGDEFNTKLAAYKKGFASDVWAVTGDKVNIKAVACWETVGSMGVPNNMVAKVFSLNKRWDFLDTQLPLRVEHAFQALGLDEHRSSFSPTLWWIEPTATWSKYPSNRIIKPELIQCWFPGHHSDVGGGKPDHKIQNLTLAWMIDQFNSRKLLDFNMDFVHEIMLSTKNNADPNWNANKDPFGEGALAVVWHLLGSKPRTPGRYTNPNLGKKPPVDTQASVTNEMIHFSVREKMDQLANTNSKVAKDVMLVSKALQGFRYQPEKKSWVFAGGDKPFELKEFPLPAASDGESVQSWLSADWLKGQEN